MLALACGPSVDNGDSEASTSMQGSSSEASSTAGSGTTAVVSESESSSGSTGGLDGCDPFPVEDAACSFEGQICSTDCIDQCQFCNVMRCESGAWTRLEVSPAPCLDCGPLCDLVVPAACSGGPPDIETCLAGCEESIAGECAAEFSNTRVCAGTEPAFICSDETRPEAAGCEAEYDALYACMGI